MRPLGRRMLLFYIASNLVSKNEAFESIRLRARDSKITALNERVGIVGAGTIALGMASLLVEEDHKVILWSPSGRSLSPKFSATGIEAAVLDSIALLLKPQQHHVIISSHASLGGLYLAQLCPQIPITAWGTTVITARQSDNQQVQFNTIRKSVDLCTIPHTEGKAGKQLCSRLFPAIQFRIRPGLLGITLSNLNPQNHLGIALGNISRMDKKEQWYQSENITPTIGKYLQDLDAEQLAIADALELPVKTIYEHFSWSFHVPISNSISKMNQQIHLQGHDVLGPDNADSQYVTEDVPFGLPLIILLVG